MAVVRLSNWARVLLTGKTLDIGRMKMSWMVEKVLICLLFLLLISNLCRIVSNLSTIEVLNKKFKGTRSQMKSWHPKPLR
jgi:hypothetical protein